MSKNSRTASETAAAVELPTTISVQKKWTRLVSHEAIAKHAYEKYLGRGCVDSLDLEDWLGAERELLALASKDSPSASA